MWKDNVLHNSNTQWFEISIKRNLFGQRDFVPKSAKLGRSFEIIWETY